MTWKRILTGKLGLNFVPFQSWKAAGITRYWSGRLIYISISKFDLILDCRDNWLEDMITGPTR